MTEEIRDMTAGEFQRHGRAAVDWVADYLENSRRYRVTADCAPGELERLLPATGPAEGERMEAILADFERLILPRLTHWNHPRFHGYFSLSSPGAGILGELLTAALDVNAMLWKSCPAATELEQVVARWVLEWLGLPPRWFGMIVDCASTAVLQAMVAARQRAEPESGGTAPSGRLTAYVSEHTHSSAAKAAMVAGIGRGNVRRVDVDRGRGMDAARLADAVSADAAAGYRPFLVVATVGTTSSTAVDPVPAIADVCRERGLWLHVDGAYGGAFGMLAECRHLLEGVERADSFVVNPHKAMMAPLDCSLLYTAHPEVLRSGFSLAADYLKSDVAAVDFMDYGIALGRRFRALKLWFVLRYFGRTGLEAHLRKNLRLAEWLAAKVAGDARLELAAPATMALVCFRARRGNGATRDLLRRIERAGEFFLSHTLLEGRLVARVAIGNLRTQQADVEALWSAIARLLEAMERESAPGSDEQID